MNVLVVHAHPAPDSFVAHLREVTVNALGGGGHEVDLCDLYGEGTDAVGQRGRLDGADGLVLVHPTWWGGHPTILKRWFEEVVGDVAAGPRPPGARVRPLRHLRKLAVVTTHGSPHWVNRLQGEPGRCTTMRALRSVMHPRARCRWLACYGLDRIDDGERAAFARRVGRALARW